MEQNIYEQMQLKDDFIKMTQQANLERACSNSCKPRKREIKGEVYVSKSSSRQEKIAQARKVIYGIAAFAMVAAAVKVSGDIDAATDIRKEVAKQETTFNSNGTYTTDRVYDEGFVDAMIDLNDGSLVKLFNETSKEMRNDGNVQESNILSEVVEEMEENYIEEHGKTM